MLLATLSLRFRRVGPLLALTLVAVGCSDDSAANHEPDACAPECAGDASLLDASMSDRRKHDASVRDHDPGVSTFDGSTPCDALMPCPDASVTDPMKVHDAAVDDSKRTVDVTIAKWYDNHTAAISLNQDYPAPERDPETIASVLGHGLRMDYELVTSKLTPTRAAYIKDMLPTGISFFGHGYEHVNHDNLTYEEALMSATQNRQTLIDLGIPPVAFAYPGGHGLRTHTQQAIEDAGFLMARGHVVTKNPYIAADDEMEPRKWFLLPDLVMESYDYQQDERRVNNTQDLIPFLDGALSRTAWIILTYHAIGRPQDFGFYYREDFELDLDEIAARDFWPANASAATLYLRERLNAYATATWYFSDDRETVDRIEVFVDDGLPNDVYTQELTLLFDIPPSWVGQPLEVQGPYGRQPDVHTRSEHVQVSLVPAEAQYTLRPARTLYQAPIGPRPIVFPEPEPEIDAGEEDSGEAVGL